MWYIGQDIVCIKNHSKGVIKEDEIFTILSIVKGCCNNSFMFDVGVKIKGINKNVVCGYCNKYLAVNTNIYWLAEELFAPLDTLVDISEIEEILQDTIKI